VITSDMQDHEDLEPDADGQRPSALAFPALKWTNGLGSARLDDLRLALMVLTAIASLVLGWSLIQQALRTGPAPVANVAAVPLISAPESPAAASLAARAGVRRKIESQLAQSPDYLRFFDQLKLAFPAEYESIMDTFAKRAAGGGETDDIDTMMSEAVRALRLSHGVLAAKADGPALQKIFVMQLAMMQALGAKDERLCVDFLYGGASRGFFQFSSENRAMVADMALAGLDAISDGQTHKIERAAPNDADFQVLEKALRDQGLSTPEIEALLDGKTADPPISTARMCKAGQIYLQTLAALPEAIRLRLYGLAVELMARS